MVALSLIARVELYMRKHTQTHKRIERQYRLGLAFSIYVKILSDLFD